jgi:membrane protein DedA with SNARE-associated domain
MSTILDWLLDLRYLAMFGILFLCGVGLPIPEEVTLVGSGLRVGWGEAEFLWASVACVLGILVGDSIIFGLGHHYGRRFLLSQPMRLLLPPRRQVKVANFFAKHGSKAVFFARFVAGVRIGVYAYAGSQRMSWLKFLFLDLLGALISGPTSIYIGSIFARQVGLNREEAFRNAVDMARRFGHWLLLGILLLVAAILIYRLCRRPAPPAKAKLPPSSVPAPGRSTPLAVSSTSIPEGTGEGTVVENRKEEALRESAIDR